LKELEREYSKLCSNFGKKISKLPDARGEYRKDLDAGSRELIESIRAVLKDMDYELKKSSEMNTKYGPAVDRMKSAFEEQQADFKRASARQQNPNEPKTERQKLLEGHAIHDSIEDTTVNIQKDLAESEQIGINVNTRLVEQREQLVHARDHLDDTESSLVRSKKVLKQMGRRVLTDKCTQGVIVIVELGIIGLIVWAKWGRSLHT